MTVRPILILITCGCLLGPALNAGAAEMSIREYPDHVVLEVDGSKDPGAAAKAPATAPAPAARAERSVAPSVPVAAAPPATAAAEPAEPVAFQAPAGASPMVSSDGYQARLQARQPGRIAERLKARQDRWSRYLRNKGLMKQQQ